MARAWIRCALVAQCGLLGALPVSAAETVSKSSEELTAASGTSASPRADAESDITSEPLRISMQFEDTDLKTVLKSFSEQSGINVIAMEGIGEKPVTFYVEDVTVLDALDQILKAANLTYERPAGSDIYIVKPKKEEAVETITRVYRLKYARVSQSIFAKAAAVFGGMTPFEAGAGGKSSGGGGGGGGGSAQAGIGIDAMLQKLLTEHGQVVVDGRTNSLMITDVPENFPRLEAALAVLDVRTPQILVDAELIETTLSKVKDLGIEWGTGTEGDLITLTPSSRTTRFPFGSLGRTAPTGPTRFGLSTLSATSFAGVLQALESDTDSKVLARPKVLTLDNESAVIRLTSDETTGFKVTTTGSGGTSQTQAEPIRTTTGIIMTVTPQINDDGNITMIVEPSVTKTVVAKVTPPTGTGTIRDPKTRSSRTLVRVRSGNTLVVGGLIDRDEGKSVRRVPILADIPFVGEAFKDQQINNHSSELIVFVTPTILFESSQGQLASAAPVGGMWSGAQAGPELPPAREQAKGGSREQLIEQTLNRLEQP